MLMTILVIILIYFVGGLITIFSPMFNKKMYELYYDPSVFQEETIAWIRISIVVWPLMWWDVYDVSEKFVFKNRWENKDDEE